MIIVYNWHVEQFQIKNKINEVNRHEGRNKEKKNKLFILEALKESIYLLA